MPRLRARHRVANAVTRTSSAAVLRNNIEELDVIGYRSHEAVIGEVAANGRRLGVDVNTSKTCPRSPRDDFLWAIPDSNR